MQSAARPHRLLTAAPSLADNCRGMKIKQNMRIEGPKRFLFLLLQKACAEQGPAEKQEAVY